MINVIHQLRAGATLGKWQVPQAVVLVKADGPVARRDDDVHLEVDIPIGVHQR